MAQHADAERVHERVAGVGLVEDHLAADVGQTQAVTVAADPGDDPGHHAGGVRGVERAEAQRIHDPDGPGAHGEDVADDAAHARRGALIGLDEAGVVVGFDLERDRVTLADVQDAGVLTDPGEQGPLGGLGGQLAELAQVSLGGLVGAVLGPHHRVHRQLARGGPSAQDLADARVLLAFQSEVSPGLFQLGGALGIREGVGHGSKLPPPLPGR